MPGMFDSDLTIDNGTVDEAPDQGYGSDDTDDGGGQGPEYMDSGDPGYSDDGAEGDDGSYDDEGPGNDDDSAGSDTFEKRYNDLLQAYGRQGQTMGEELARLRAATAQQNSVLQAILPAVLQGQQGQGQHVDKDALLEKFAEDPLGVMGMVIEENNRRQAAATAAALGQVLEPVQGFVAAQQTDTRIRDEVSLLATQAPDFDEVRPLMLNLLQTVPAYQGLPSQQGGMIYLYQVAKATMGAAGGGYGVPGSDRKRGLRPPGGMGRAPQGGGPESPDEIIQARVMGTINPTGQRRARGIFS